MPQIWIITHNAAPPQYQNHMRNLGMAKYMVQDNYDVTIFGASTVPNTNINLIEDERKYIVGKYNGYSLVNIKSPSYTGNGLSRVLNFTVYPFRLWKCTKKFSRETGERPEIIINDLNVLSLWFPFWISRKFKVPIITEVRDLWPESLISYGIIDKNSIITNILRRFEKQMYRKSDRVIFSMGGGYKYIEDQGWGMIIPREKTTIISNGFDLSEFEENAKRFQIEDMDLNDSTTIKIVYTGAIRKVNNLGLLLDIAKKIKNPSIRFLIWGDGTELKQLCERKDKEKIDNVIFKGSVEKKYIPFIVKNANFNFLHNSPSEVIRKYGISANKMYEYLAAGKPILYDFPCDFNPIKDNDAGYYIGYDSPENVAKRIDDIVIMQSEDFSQMCKNAVDASRLYDFSHLAKLLEEQIETIRRKGKA